MNMRLLTKILLPTLIVAIASPALSAEDAAAQDGKVPDIEVLERVHDAGEVQKGEKITYNFKVRNKGEAPLQIFDARPSCGCTVTSFDRTVLPGKVGKVEAVIDTNRVGTGSLTKSVTIKSNDPDEESILLQLKANVVALAYAIPPSVFIRSDRLESPEAEFLVRGHESNPFEIESVTSDVEYLNFEVEKIKKVEEAGSAQRGGRNRPEPGDYRVKVKLDEKTPTGDMAGNIIVHTTSKETPSLKVMFRGTVTGLITAIPRRVYLRIQNPDQLLEATEDAKIRRQPSIESPEAGEVRKGEALTVLPEPPSLDPEDEWVRVRTAHRRVGYLYRKFTRKVRGDRAQVTQSRNIQLRKNDGAPFKIRKVESSLEGVKIDTDTLEEGRAYQVTVTYDGDLGRGSHQGELVIQTTDKDEPTIKVPFYIHVT